MILSYDFLGLDDGAVFSSTNVLNNFYRLDLKNVIVDEIHVREKTNGINEDTDKATWQNDTRLLAKFINNLEAGNIDNEGVQIVKFAIKRRKIDEFTDDILAYTPFKSGTQIEYVDNSQANTKYIYSIAPIGENSLEGKSVEIEIESNFTGWFVVDKKNGDVITFDKSIGGDNPSVSTTLNQGRTQINTLSKFPQVYYNDQEYHSLTLSSIFTPDNGKRSNSEYEKILNLILQHKPLIVKGSSGEFYICDISNPQNSTPRNTWGGYDYTTIQVDAVEIMNEKTYLQNNIEEIGDVL